MTMTTDKKAEGVLASFMNDCASVTLTCELNLDTNKVEYVVDAPDNVDMMTGKGFFKRYTTYAEAKDAYAEQVAENSAENEG